MILDSSALIASLNPNDSHFSEVWEKMSASNSIQIHEVSLAESLVRAHTSNTVEQVMHVFKGIGATLVSSAGLQGALRVAEIRSKTGLPLPDCYVIDAGRETDEKILSFDSKLNRSAKTLGLATIN